MIRNTGGLGILPSGCGVVSVSSGFSAIELDGKGSRWLFTVTLSFEPVDFFNAKVSIAALGEVCPDIFSGVATVLKIREW